MASNDSTPKTIEIQLTKGFVAVVDECDADLATFSWHSEPRDNGLVYATRNDYKGNHKITHQRLHRIILERVLNRRLLRVEKVDHKDNNPLNNRRCNLRLATDGQNRANSRVRKDCKSGCEHALPGQAR